MPLPENHLLVVGMRKSANVFIQRTIERTLSAAFVRLVDDREALIPAQLDAFFALDCATGGEHFAASEHNLRLLAAHGVSRIALLAPDPRDAVISWWHHLERADIKTKLLAVADAGPFGPA